MASANTLENTVLGLLTVSETARYLNVTRVTLYKWISMGIIRPAGHEVLGGRHHYWFNPGYIERVKLLLPKARKPGTPLLTSSIEQRIKTLS